MTQAEWGLFRIGLEELVVAIEEDLLLNSDDAVTGVKAFDRLTAEQKLALLGNIAEAMYDPRVPMPDLTAASEGGVAAVLVVIEALLRDEIRTKKNDTSVRSRLLAVGAEAEDDLADDLPNPASRNWDDWSLLLECFEGSLLWDNDWAAEAHYLDLPTPDARAKMEYMGIDPAYYLAIPPEPKPAELMAAREGLSRLLAAPREKGLR